MFDGICPLFGKKMIKVILRFFDGVKYRGLVGTCMTVAKEEGAGGLWKGLGPGLQRQVIYGGLRIGLYDPVKKFCTDVAGGDSLAVKIASGLLSGAIGITVASPTDLVKVRMQSQGKQPPGVPKKYPSALSAYRLIVKYVGDNVGRHDEVL